MDAPLRVLIVEDSEDDALLIERELQRSGYEPIVQRVDTAQAFRAALTKQTWAAVVADYSMPHFDGLTALELLQEHGLDLPFILVSGERGEDTAVAAMRAGAHDYVLKDSLARLGPAIRRELREAQGRRTRKQAEQGLRQRTALLEALQQVAMELTVQLDLDTLLHSIVSRAIELLDGTAGGLYLHQPEQDRLEWALGIGPDLPPIGTILQRGEGLCGKVWESGEPLIVNDYQSWQGRTDRFDSLRNVATVGALVRWGDESLGVLNVLADLSRPFSPADAEMLGLFAIQAAIAIRNARLYEATQARSRYLETLQRINATLRSTLPLDEVLDIIVQATGEALGYVGSVIGVPDAGNERLILGAAWGSRFLDAATRLIGLEVDLFSLPLSVEENPMARAYRDGELQVQRQDPERIILGAEPRISPRLAPLLQRAMGAKLMACIPLPGVEGMVGVLVVFSPRGQLQDEERAMLLGLADQAGLAIENARLYQEARRRADQLTVVNHVARAVGATLHLDDLLETVYQEVVSIFASDAFFIALCDEQGGELDFRLQVDKGIRQAPERHGVGDGLTSLVVASKKPLLVRDLKQERDSLPEPQLWGTMKLPASWLGVPMQIGDQLVGVICVQSYKSHAYSHEDQLLLSTIADQIAVAVQQARLVQTLRESEERYRALFEQANDAVFLETPDGRILDVNERACQLFGYRREEFLQLSVDDIVPPEVAERLPRIMEQENARAGLHLEAENVRSDGSRVAVDVSTTLLEVGGHNLVLAVVRDVTERKQAEEALRDSEVKHRLLLSSIRSPVLAVDQDMTILYCNDAYAEFVGKPAAELEGENLLALFPEFADQRSFAAYRQVLETGEPARVEGPVGGRHLRSWIYPTPWGILAIGEDVTERRRAEQAVAERQRYLEGVLASAPDAIVTLDAQHRIVEWNQGAQRLFGYTSREVIGRNIDHLITNPDVLEGAESLTRVVLSGEPLPPREVIRYRKDGSPVHVMASGSPILVEDRLIGVVAIYTDISERKQAEVALRENEEKYSNLFHHSNDGIFLHDLEGNILDVNQRALDQLGYTRSEVLSLTIADLHPPEALESSRRAFAQTAREGSVSFEISFARKNGQVFPAEVSASLFEIGGNRVVQGVVRDITERKRAERLLGALNEASLAVERALTLQEIFTAVGEELAKLGFFCAVFLVDDSRTSLTLGYLNYDPEAVKVAQKLVAMRAEDLVFPIDTVDLFRQVIREGETVFADQDRVIGQVLPEALGELVGQVKSILQVPKSIQAPLVVENRGVGLLSVQSDDLTEDDVPAITAFAHQVAAAWRKAQLLQDLEESLEELKRTQAQFLQAQKMEAVGRLAGGVAHDLNNMLTVVQFSTQLIERQLRPQDPVWEHARQIREASERASRLTKHLLIFSRREVVEPRLVNLSRLVSDLSQMLRRIIGEDIELLTPLAESLWPVKVDPSQVEQATVNLVVNARDAMPRGGRLTIETANAVLDEAYAARHLDVQPGDYVLLTVSDTGVGMSDEVQAHLFEPFFTTKERGKGTGLGLATVFGIIKRHGGHIGVLSEPEQGTVFRIYLPRAEDTAAAPQLPSRASPPYAVQGTETILVVEDDVNVQELATQILAGHGYRVLAAGNGLEALRVSEDYGGSIDLLLTDVILPKMNGRELTKRLQAQRPDVRVLYMSGYSDDLIAHHGVLDEGIVLLSKPFTMDTLLQKVRARLDATP
jgi:two-component system cell cycle sensor histidine kinase/response regulator CckA